MAKLPPAQDHEARLLPRAAGDRQNPFLKCHRGCWSRIISKGKTAASKHAMSVGALIHIIHKEHD